MQNEERDTYPIYVIDLNESRNWGDCHMCGEDRRLDHAVAWYCGPTHDEIGSVTTEYTDGGTVGGMCVCKTCHDGWYGIKAPSGIEALAEKKP